MKTETLKAIHDLAGRVAKVHDAGDDLTQVYQRTILFCSDIGSTLTFEFPHKPSALREECRSLAQSVRAAGGMVDRWDSEGERSAEGFDFHFPPEVQS